jgi:O-acetyl-ADP-ribose deacetylase (regulator of RNase III)
MDKERMNAIQGDITKLEVDAIVNAANNSLLGGGGVDGAIHRAAGLELLEECKTLGGCDTGDAKITKGYNLPAKHVIHTVGPVWHGGSQGEPEKLASCYQKSLKVAEKNGIKTIAFPAISCGVYGYPVVKAAQIAVREVAAFLNKHPSIDQVTFVGFDQGTYETYSRLLDELDKGPKWLDSLDLI